MSVRKLLPAIAGSALLGACAGTSSSEYPSLAIRDVERAEGNFAPVATQTLAVPEIDLDRSAPQSEQLASLLGQAREAHARFLVSQPIAERRVGAAAASSVGSDAWAAAQVALADLDSIRSQAAVPLGDLDILYTASTIQAEEVQAVADAREQVIELVAKEDAVLERLRERLR